MNSETKKFARRLRRLREAFLASQSDLAVISGLSRQTINLLEKAQREPSLTTLTKLASALRCSIDELVAFKLPVVKVHTPVAHQ